MHLNAQAAAVLNGAAILVGPLVGRTCRPPGHPSEGLLEEPNYLLRRHDTLGGVKTHAIGVNGTARAVRTLAISSIAIITFIFTSTLEEL